MKVKSKLRLGFGFLFIIVLFFGALSIFLINQAATQGKVILKNNYESLMFTREMRAVLDNNSLPLNAAAAKAFAGQLQKQERNITEPGEKQATSAVRRSFISLNNAAESAQQGETLKHLRHELSRIEQLNMAAIVRKNEAANKSVDRTILYLSLAGSFTFLILFSFSVNFPGMISGPLNSLLTGIRQIGQQNYQQRIHFDNNDEFAEVANAFNDMAARLREWETSNLSEIMSEKQRIETIIEQMQDAIIGVNEQQQILFINPQARKMLGLQDGRYEGMPVTDLAAGNDLLRSILDAKANIKPLPIVVDGRNAFFQSLSFEITVPNIAPANKEAITLARRSAGRVYMLRNVTEFKERDEAKTNFIATISHELKTPISSIKMSLKLMKDKRVGEINTEQQQLLEHISDDSERLLKITSELLELSQAETGNIQLNFVQVNPAEIVDYAVASIKFPAAQKGVNVKVIQSTNLPPVNADMEKTAWVLINFLSNALRYSSEKADIIVQLKQLRQEVEFSVTDNGKGIDEQYQKRLFDRYFQVPTDGNNPSGSGLGLAISKDFIEAQNGRIWVKSAIGEGSTFSFTLPATVS